jgi:hypothetical protein
MPYTKLLSDGRTTAKKASTAKDRFVIGAIWSFFALVTVWTHPPFSQEAVRHNVGLSPAIDPLLAIRVEAKFTRFGVPPTSQIEAN